MQSLFSAPVWLWSLLFALAVALPLLIHLINFLRYRRVKWAAMDFLLKSHRKKQKKILLTQLLLIVSRILVLLAAIFLFGHIGCHSDLSSQRQDGMLHIVILDDSFSMGEVQVVDQNRSESATGSALDRSDSFGKSTCFQNAKRSILDLAENLARHPNQRFQLIRTSLGEEENRKLNWDCDSNLVTALEKHFATNGVSDHSGGLLQLSAMDLESVVERNSHVYLLSDFRSKDLADDRIAALTAEIGSLPQGLTVVNCSHQQSDQGNLSISRFEPEHELVVSGIPFYLTLEVFNHSRNPKRNIEIKVRTATVKRRSLPDLTFDEEPPAFIPVIGPGEKQVLQIPIVIPTDGPVLFEAELPSDSLAVDNVFHRVVDVKPARRILLISDRKNQPSQYLRWVYEPKLSGSNARSGIQVEQLSSAEFGQQNAPNLDGIQVVFLLSDDVSSTKMVNQLEGFVDSGGLLFVCPGRYAKASAINKSLFRDGKGLIPFPLDSAIDLPPRPTNVDSDIEILNERLREYFQGESRKLLSLVRFEKKFIPPRNWSPQPGTEILVEIRGRATTPLVTQSNFGNGTVITILSSFDDQWNNWPKNPTFLVMMYRLVYQYLPFDPEWDLKVGYSVQQQRGQDVNEGVAAAPVWFKRNLQALALSRKPKLDTSGEWRPERKGIYLLDTTIEQVFATQLDQSESDLANSKREVILDTLRLHPDNYVEWNKSSISDTNSTSRTTAWILLLLGALFAIEQWLAFRSGFHNREKNQSPRRAVGGRRV